MKSDPLVKVSSTSERFAKMRAKKAAHSANATSTTTTTAAATAAAAAATTTNTNTNTVATASNTKVVSHPVTLTSDDPLSQFQKEHNAKLEAAAVSQNIGSSSHASTVGTPKKNLPPKAPVRLEVTANAMAEEFLKGCDKPIGERADKMAVESLEGVMEVGQRGAWAHVLSGAPLHLLALRSQNSEATKHSRCADHRALAVLQLVAYVQLGQYMLAADAIKEQLQCVYLEQLEANESAGVEGKVARNIAALQVQNPVTASIKLKGAEHKVAENSGIEKNFNVPVAALMIHAELPFGLHKNAQLVLERLQMLMQEIDRHACRIEGARTGNVGYSDAEIKIIVETTGALPSRGTMSPERMRDAYSALVAEALEPGAKIPALVPDHFKPIVLMDHVQCCAWRIRLLETMVAYSIPAGRVPLAVQLCEAVYERTSRYLENAQSPHTLSIFTVASLALLEYFVAPGLCISQSRSWLILTSQLQAKDPKLMHCCWNKLCYIMHNANILRL